MFITEKFGQFELFLLFSVLPAVFIYLWKLIFGDIENFVDSRKRLLTYTATDMVNCYQNYTANVQNSKQD